MLRYKPDRNAVRKLAEKGNTIPVYAELLSDSLTPVSVTGLATSAVDAACGYSHTCAVLDTGAVLCWGKNDRQQLGDGTSTNRSEPVDVSCP